MGYVVYHISLYGLTLILGHRQYKSITRWTNFGKITNPAANPKLTRDMSFMYADDASNLNVGDNLVELEKVT
jgi:hypothetical protein